MTGAFPVVALGAAINLARSEEELRTRLGTYGLPEATIDSVVAAAADLARHSYLSAEEAVDRVNRQADLGYALAGRHP